MVLKQSFSFIQKLSFYEDAFYLNDTYSTHDRELFPAITQDLVALKHWLMLMVLAFMSS